MASKSRRLRVMRLRFHGIPEKDQGIDLPFSDAGPDLLIATQGTAKEFMNGLAQRLLHQGSGCAGAIQPVPGQGGFIIDRPFDQLTFLIVMRYQRYPLGGSHFSDGRFHAILFVF